MVIRSQNGNTLAHFTKDTMIIVDEDGTVKIYTTHQRAFIGRYSTKEAALQVLDNLAKAYQKIFVDGCAPHVFQMPKDFAVTQEDKQC